VREQRTLYKGISSDLVDTIFDTLYRKSVTGPAPSTLLTNTELTAVDYDGERYTLGLRHIEQGGTFALTTGALVLATGYRPRIPHFLDPVRDRIRWDERGRFQVDERYAIDRAGREIFVQNAEEHTHGFTAPDLGMGAYRNSVILAAMLGREVYPIERRIAFQQFGPPDATTEAENVLRAAEVGA
jgi:lysine N6-hydroxylase